MQGVMGPDLQYIKKLRWEHGRYLQEESSTGSNTSLEGFSTMEKRNKMTVKCGKFEKDFRDT